MSNRAAAGVVAAAVLLVALIVGLWPHSVSNPTASFGDEQTVSCGSAFSPNDAAVDAAGIEADVRRSFGSTTAAFDPEAACSDALTTPRVVALVLAGLGVLGGLFLALTVKREPYVAGTMPTMQDSQPVVSRQDDPETPTQP